MLVSNRHQTPGTLKPTAGHYRHNPYAGNILNAKDSELALLSCQMLYAAASGPSQAALGATTAHSPVVTKGAMSGKISEVAEALEHSMINEDGVSEVGSSDCGVGENNKLSGSNSQRVAVHSQQLTPELPSLEAPRVTLRYASVDFRFGCAWFIAPFRTLAGDMVVVEYPSNQSLHMGIVSSITTEKPLTFYTEGNTDPNYLSPEEIASLPRLLRHARDFDRETKLELRKQDLRALVNAQRAANEMGAAVTFLDAEWLLDLNTITFLVHVRCETELADQLADELAQQEGAEVIFTFPATV